MDDNERRLVELEKQAREHEHQIVELITHLARVEQSLNDLLDGLSDSAGRKRAGISKAKQDLGANTENNGSVPGSHQGQNRTET